MSPLRNAVVYARLLRSTRRASPVFILGFLLAGCVSYFALDPYLSEAVGSPPEATKYPRLKYQRVKEESESTRVVEYSIDSLWRCRWIYQIDKSTGNVASWSYPDQDAKRFCGELPSSRP